MCTLAMRKMPVSSSPSLASPDHRAPGRVEDQNPEQRYGSAVSSLEKDPIPHLGGKLDGIIFYFLHPCPRKSDQYEGTGLQRVSLHCDKQVSSDHQDPNNRAAVFLLPNRKCAGGPRKGVLWHLHGPVSHFKYPGGSF